MISCGECGLPAPADFTICSLCGEPLPAVLPGAVRLRVAGSLVQIVTDATPLAIAMRSGLHWTASRVDGSPIFRLAPLATAAGTSCAVLAPDSQLLGTVLHPRSGEPAAVVAGPAGGTVAVLYTDGPTGLHLVGKDGEVFGLMSREEHSPSLELDVLFTTLGKSLPAELVYGLLVSLGALVESPRS